jgi:diaminopimelate epimerase
VSLHFTKMEGCGNDYVYVELFSQTVPIGAAPALARAISDRHFGVGSDGLILVAPEPGFAGRMIMFNADGSRGSMCGNGIRCVARLLHDRGLAEGLRLRIATDAGPREVELHLEQGQVAAATVDMGTAQVGASGSLEAEGRRFDFNPVALGNPHCVVFLDEDLDRFPIERYGPTIGRHPAFPDGANVEFVTPAGAAALRQRTFERGSGETLACGTGACAAVAASTARGLVSEGVVTVHLRGGDLRIRLHRGTVWMTGPARTVFHGEWPG